MCPPHPSAREATHSAAQTKIKTLRLAMFAGTRLEINRRSDKAE